MVPSTLNMICSSIANQLINSAGFKFDDVSKNKPEYLGKSDLVFSVALFSFLFAVGDSWFWLRENGLNVQGIPPIFLNRSPKWRIFTIPSIKKILFNLWYSYHFALILSFQPLLFRLLLFSTTTFLLLLST